MNQLFTRATLILVAIILLATLGNSITLLFVWNEKRILDRMVSETIRDMVAVAEMDIALLRQRGLAASYMLSEGDDKWLQEMEQFEPLFRSRLRSVQDISDSEKEHQLLMAISIVFNIYDAKRDEFIAVYERGISIQERKAYLEELNNYYLEVAKLCDEVVEVNKRDIQDKLAKSDHGVRQVTVIILISIALTSIFVAALILLLVRRVFIPLKEIEHDVQEFSIREGFATNEAFKDDPAAIQYYLKSLMTGFSEVRSDLESSRMELQHQQRLAAVGKVVAHIAHEIKNSLAVIGGFARSLEKRPERVDLVKGDAQIINQEVSRLERMLTDVMKYSKPMRVERTELPLNQVISDALNVFSNQIPAQISVTVSLDPQNPIVPLDSGPITQVILNLIKNSVEALENGGEIAITTESNERQATISIKDNGPGIPDSVRSKIYEPFFTTKKQGNGLGLAICSQIISEHGGIIEVESVPNQETTFRITFKRD
ncbi:MCP four helix bundle domain-containing protein [bacterium]|nr:MCP four helix bundle domain-containing protein [bacterium]